ncbi:hypothetical protein Pmani_040258 [Petrolisthes manimaculis]|uniref:Uncharacterized protein n=1 Tax=Petrolisthes manimaculis TaxID=1843537 RepID=A0AAE1TIR0_9EUCA|nr:hypothetical protein Pmani_040258 [Petrolisthes manimaculis]
MRQMDVDDMCVDVSEWETAGPPVSSPHPSMTFRLSSIPCLPPHRQTPLALTGRASAGRARDGLLFPLEISQV